jgi:hypothetical protein
VSTFAVALLLASAPRATDPPSPSGHVVITAGDNALDATAIKNSPGTYTPHNVNAEKSSNTAPPPPTFKPCETGSIFDCAPGQFLCTQADGSVLIKYDGQVHQPSTDPLTECGSPATENIAALVLRAFQRIPLPAPTLDIQPPKGKTLIGLETIYSTKAEPFTRNLTLLGQPIQLRIHATSYTWNHGDNTTQTTDWPGKPWQRGTSIEHYITHTYEDTGNVTPTVRVTWSAEYRIGNGTWQPVNGTVERTSPPTALQIVEAEPQLVAP